MSFSAKSKFKTFVNVHNVNILALFQNKLCNISREKKGFSLLILIFIGFWTLKIFKFSCCSILLRCRCGKWNAISIGMHLNASSNSHHQHQLNKHDERNDTHRNYIILYRIQSRHELGLRIFAFKQKKLGFIHFKHSIE